MNHLIEDTRRNAAQKVVFVRHIILQMHSAGAKINYCTVARIAGVSRQFLYRHPALQTMIEDYRVSGLSKESLQHEVIKLRCCIRELERRLEAYEKEDTSAKNSNSTQITTG